MIYGAPGDRNLSRLLAVLRRAPLLPVPGGGRHLQQPVHVADVADAVLNAAQHRVDELMLDGDVGVFGLELVDGGAPELRALEDVGLVDLSEFLAALAGEVEGDAGDADDFVFGVAHGVDGFAGLFVPRAGLAEVEAAEELAHEEDVDALGDFGTEWRVVGERGEGEAGAEICKASEHLADLQQAGFGTLVGVRWLNLLSPTAPRRTASASSAVSMSAWAVGCLQQ